MTPPAPPPRRAPHSLHPLAPRGPKVAAARSFAHGAGRKISTVSALSVLGASGVAVALGAYAIPAVLPVGGEPYTSPPPALPTSTTVPAPGTTTSKPAPTETITDQPTAPSGTPPTTLPPGSSPVTPPGSKPTTPAPPTAPATPSSPATPLVRSVTGAIAKHKYGPVQLRINLEGTRIVGIDVLQRPKGGTSDTINNDALPKLTAQALKKQNAALDSVSGATLTSKAYKASLQSALDKAKG